MSVSESDPNSGRTYRDRATDLSHPMSVPVPAPPSASSTPPHRCGLRGGGGGFPSASAPYFCSRCIRINLSFLRLFYPTLFYPTLAPNPADTVGTFLTSRL